jgi:hypothetical protein
VCFGQAPLVSDRRPRFLEEDHVVLLGVGQGEGAVMRRPGLGDIGLEDAQALSPLSICPRCAVPLRGVASTAAADATRARTASIMVKALEVGPANCFISAQGAGEAVPVEEPRMAALYIRGA